MRGYANPGEKNPKKTFTCERRTSSSGVDDKYEQHAIQTTAETICGGGRLCNYK